MGTLAAGRRYATIRAGPSGVMADAGGRIFLARRTREARMPKSTIINSELEGGAELTVRYALLDGVHWHFQNAELCSEQGRILASYPSSAEAARLLGSELRPALARLKAVLDRVRLNHPTALIAEARLQRLSLSFLVGDYLAQDENGNTLCYWRNPVLPPRPQARRLATG